MYEFLTGPGLWISFVVCIGGLIIKMTYLFGLSRNMDKVFYNHADFGWGFKSIIHWLIPFASSSMRKQPLFTIMIFAFHIPLIVVPLFNDAHNILWDENFNVSLYSMPDSVADAMTVVLIFSGLFLLIRRLVRPEVRILTEAWDYALLLLTMLPFATGFLAYHQWGHYETMLLLHIASSEILLIIIPFSKLSHVILFFFTRAFIGFEMGSRRGARSW
jgi:nitrate reductase gamma subunit